MVDSAIVAIGPHLRSASLGHAAGAATREIAFIDPAVSDVHVLLAGLRPNVRPILLNTAESAPRQMASALAGCQGLGAIHIIAHGAPGEVSFAAGALSAVSVEDHAADLAALGARLGRDASVMLWTCETGQGRRGQDFIDALAAASGAKVAAATRFIGAAARGGGWELDMRAGAPNVPAPLSAAGIASYQGVMGTRTWQGPVPGTITNPTSGNWSTAANWGNNLPANGDSIVFPASGTHAAYTVALDLPTSPTFSAATLNGGATLAVGANGLVVNATGGGVTDLLSVASGATVSMTTGGSITAGSVTVSGILRGAGTVTISANGARPHTINGAGAITATGGLLDLNGKLTGTTALTITSATDTLRLDGAGSAATSVNFNGSAGTFELSTAATLTLANALTVGIGTLKLDGAGTPVQLIDIAGITLAGGTLSGTGLISGTTFVTGSGTIGISTVGRTMTASGGTLDITGAMDTTSKLSIADVAGSVLKIDNSGVTIKSVAVDTTNKTLEIAKNATISNPETISGTLTVDGGVTLSMANTLNNNAGGQITINGTLAESGTHKFNNAGTITLVGGTLTNISGVAMSTGALLNGRGLVNGDISGTGVIDADGGVLDVSNNVASGTILLEVGSAASSVLELGGTVVATTSFTYLNTTGFSGTLQLDQSALLPFSANGVITGMHVGSSVGGIPTPTDELDLRSIPRSSAYSTDILGGQTIQLWTDATHTNLLASFRLTSPVAAGTFVDWQADGAGGTDLFLNTDPCYVAGTHILTATGERMVETLMKGDIVLTLSGGELIPQPVKWIGRRRIDLTAHPRPETVAPVRIRRGAFADNMPHCDLLVSPDHAIFVDGKLICARQLVNGTTIRQEKDWSAVEYFHVELDAHAILLAEGLPAESYLNTGNHGFFINSGEPLVLHPDLTDETDYPAREAASCAPFVWDEAGVLPVWQRLAERAAALGQPAPRLATTGDPELRIVAKGRTVRPLYGEHGLYIFALPKGATEVCVVSRAGAPTDARPWLDDRRCLGVNVERVVLRGANELRELPVDHPDLSQGWHAVERHGGSQGRWTNGDAVLPLPVLVGPIMLEIRAGNGGMNYLTDGDQERRAS